MLALNFSEYRIDFRYKMNQYQSGLINRINSTLLSANFRINLRSCLMSNLQKFLSIRNKFFNNFHLRFIIQFIWSFAPNYTFTATSPLVCSRRLRIRPLATSLYSFFVSCVKFSRGTRTHIHFSFYHHFLPILCCYFKNIIFCLPPALATSWAETRVAVWFRFAIKVTPIRY